MPNTLVHIGVQGTAFGSLLFRATDLRWVLLGCILPDIPWILKRILLVLLPQGDYPVLNSYILLLASLSACLLLALAFALLSGQTTRIFLVLALGALTHLLLDACQDKWGNGVLLLAPFDWRLIHFDLFSVASSTTLLLTIWGGGYAIIVCKKAFSTISPLNKVSSCRWRSSLAFLALYLWLPAFFISDPWDADTGYCRTLYLKGDRPGRFIEFDRVPFVASPDGGYLDIPLSGEKVFLDGVPLKEDGSLSVKGTFLAPDKVAVTTYRVEPKTFRDSATYAGLLYVGLAWLVPFGEILRLRCVGDKDKRLK